MQLLVESAQCWDDPVDVVLFCDSLTGCNAQSKAQVGIGRQSVEGIAQFPHVAWRHDQCMLLVLDDFRHTEGDYVAPEKVRGTPQTSALVP